MELDGEQEYAVGLDKSQIVIAGPGSGKTRMLTEKARTLFNAGENIICLCFTRSAAREMASRVPNLPASTIHSYCHGRVGWDSKWGYPGLLYRFLMSNKDDNFDWVLVDEIQDLNELEMDVVLSLMGGKMFAVGDPYQSIYGFQGAMGPKVVGLLEKVGCERTDLHNNYRSCEKVVEGLNKIGWKCDKPKATNEDVFYVSNYLKSVQRAHRVRLSAEQSDSREYDVIKESNLRVSTIHQSKGMEFDQVILFGWRPNERGEEERVYYVAAARASKEFIEVGSLRALDECL